MRIRCLLLALAAGLSLISTDTTAFGTDAPSDHELKAILLYKFTKFVDWPAPTDQAQRFRICVVGETPITESLAKLDGKTVRNQPLLITQIVSARQALRYCQLLFIAQSEHRRLKAILTEIESAPILTVSDIPKFAEHGGIIGLRSTAQRIQFVINRRAAQHAQLTLSAQLLQVAVTVIGEHDSP